jgi:hypothetical protein
MALDKDVSYTGQQQVDTLSSKVRIEEGKGRLLAFDGSNNLGLFGYDDAGQVVVKIAKSGFDANSAGDSDLIFNSNQNVFKIVEKLSFAFSISSGAGGSTNTLIYTHNLGYEPLIFGAATVTGGGNLSAINGTIMLPYLLPGLSSGIGNISASLGISKITTTEIWINYLIYLNSSLSGTFNLYVLQETAA